MSVINMYEKSDVIRFLDKKPLNLNIDLHGFEIPFRAIVCAPSGSGNTCFVTNLIALMSQGKGTFATCDIITKNKDEPLYRWVESKCDSIIIQEGLSNTPKLDDFDKDVNHLVVWDDLVLSKDLSNVENYYIRARKLNVSVIFISQSYFKIPKVIRNNCSYMVLLKLSGQREVNIILSEFGLGVTKQQLMDIYKYATNVKFSPLIIDMEIDGDHKFRKGFLEIIDF